MIQFQHPDGRMLALGKKPPRIDPRTLHLGLYDGLLPTPPPVWSWFQDVKEWGMMQNDTLGDCTCAAVGHGGQVTTLNTPTGIRTPPDQLVLNLYQKACGYVPGDPSTDQGGVILDVLTYVRKYALGHKKAPNYHKKFRMMAFAAVNPGNLLHVMQAIYLLSVVDIGIQLPISAQAQVGGLWDVVGNPRTNPQSVPGSWGGHSVIVSAYTPDTVTCVTWGALQTMTWRFWATYVDESYVLLYRSWLEHFRSKAPAMAVQLESDVHLLTA